MWLRKACQGKLFFSSCISINKLRKCDRVGNVSDRLRVHKANLRIRGGEPLHQIPQVRRVPGVVVVQACYMCNFGDGVSDIERGVNRINSCVTIFRRIVNALHYFSATCTRVIPRIVVSVNHLTWINTRTMERKSQQSLIFGIDCITN